MSSKIAVINQKGGSGKSTVARALATSYASANWNVKIADLDINQSTSRQWQQRRLQNNVSPAVAVETFGTAQQAIKVADNYDLFIFDGAPVASRSTIEISKASDLIIIPCSISVDDLNPSISLARDLKSKGIDAHKICFVFNRATSSESEYKEAQELVRETPFKLIDGRIEDKASYRQAMDSGLSIVETQYKSPREKADKVFQNIIDYFEHIEEKEHA